MKKLFCVEPPKQTSPRLSGPAGSLLRMQLVSPTKSHPHPGRLHPASWILSDTENGQESGMNTWHRSRSRALPSLLPACSETLCAVSHFQPDLRVSSPLGAVRVLLQKMIPPNRNETCCVSMFQIEMSFLTTRKGFSFSSYQKVNK